MKARNFVISKRMPVLLVLFLIVSLSACVTTRSSLDAIDKSYKQEFCDSVIPQDENVGKFSNKGLFVKTLDLTDEFIRDYKDKATDSEIAHVKVLQSLIFLQKGEFNKAKLAIKLAENYKQDAEQRDKTLMDSLPDIIFGWETSENVKNEGNQNKIIKALRTLGSVLEKLDEKNYKIFIQKKNLKKGGEEIYFYLTAARSIFHYNKAFLIRDLGYEEYSETFHKDGEKQVKEDYGKAVTQLEEVLEEYLPENEFEILKNAKFTFHNEDISVSSDWFKGESRFVRYKALYIFLKEKRNSNL